MTKIELIETIDLSLKDLIKNDHLLFLNHVREEAVNHRFALYFENHLKIKFPILNLHFDVEYNKNYFDEKQIIDENDERITFRPDFIVHQRLSNENNLIAFEMKKLEPNTKDIRTITGILKDPFNYNFGINLSYYPDGDNFVYQIHNIENEIQRNEVFEVNKNDLINA